MTKESKSLEDTKRLMGALVRMKPKLHEEMKADTPKPYFGLVEAYREIIPAILRQVKDPTYYVQRELPPSAKPFPTPGMSASAAQ